MPLKNMYNCITLTIFLPMIDIIYLKILIEIIITVATNNLCKWGPAPQSIVIH